MLKITTRQDGELITLVVEGRLAGPWVQELEDYWSHIANDRKHGAVVNFTGVTFIDQSGQTLLHRLWQEGAELEATGCLNNCLVDQITASSRFDRPKTHRSKTN